MTECNSAECNSYETHNICPNLNATPLNDQQKFRLSKINEIKNYFVAEINKKQKRFWTHKSKISGC